MRWYLAAFVFLALVGSLAVSLMPGELESLRTALSPPAPPVIEPLPTTPDLPVPQFVPMVNEPGQRPPLQTSPTNQTVRTDQTVSVKAAKPLQIQDWGYERRAGVMVASGEVTNAGTESLRNVLVEVQFFRKDGVFVKGSTVTIDPNPFPPGETSRFEVTESDAPEVEYAMVRFRDMTGRVVPHRDGREANLAEQIAEQNRLVADRERRRLEVLDQASQGLSEKQQEQQQQASAAWESLQAEIQDGLTLQTRDKIRALVKEFPGTSAGIAAAAEAEADRLLSLAKQYERVGNRAKVKVMVREITDQFPDTISSRIARKWLAGLR